MRMSVCCKRFTNRASEKAHFCEARPRKSSRGIVQATQTTLCFSRELLAGLDREYKRPVAGRTQLKRWPHPNAYKHTDSILLLPLTDKFARDHS